MTAQNQTSVNKIKPTQIMSVSPVVYKVPGRQVDLEIRVSAPVTGENLPVILFWGVAEIRVNIGISVKRV